MIEHEGAITVTPSFVSGYMSSGVRLGVLSFQPTLESTKMPPSLELFANTPIAGGLQRSSDPVIDFSASFTWDIAPNLFTVKPGVCLHTYPKTDEDDSFY